jgi:hypothetical protein
MNNYREEVHQIRLESYTSKERCEKRNGLLKKRTQDISDLLKSNSIMQREKARSER